MSWESLSIEDKAHAWNRKAIDEIVLMESDLEKWFRANPQQRQVYLERRGSRFWLKRFNGRLY